MKKSLYVSFGWFCTLLFVFILAGCAGLGGAGSTSGGADDKSITSDDVLRPGDRVKISFSGMPVDQQMLPQEEQINDSGDIVLPYIGAVKAAGKSVGQLQRDIQAKYVPTYFRNLNVSVNTERFYFVGGEVKLPGRQPYLTGITVLKAIQSAQDFTDFADRKHVRLTRSNGRTEIVNCKKALENAQLDLPVYPGDTVTVPRGF
jgi:protein involved in polysaccharide export with SLBB domain